MVLNTWGLLIALVATFNTGLLILAYDWGVEQYSRTKLGRWCDFCVSFWLALFELLIYTWCTGSGFLFVIPAALCAATLSRRLL